MFLLSLHDVYYKRLLSGEKLFEFRKRIPAGLKSGDELAIYCTKPTCSVVAYAEIGGVLEDAPQKLWNRTRFAAGIEKDAFLAYFSGSKKAYAIIIHKVHPLRQPISMEALRGKDSAPQSFIYLTDDQGAMVRRRGRKPEDHGLSVFIGGVHGVGKTTICNDVLDPLGFDCCSASDLIRRRVTMHKTDKRVKNVDGNQEVLVRESSKEAAKTLLYGLDGHFCVLDARGEIERLSIEVFRLLKLNILVLIDSTVDVVQNHLRKRDGTAWTKTRIARLMRAERTHAKIIAAKLGIPLLVIDAGGKDQMKRFVDSLDELLSVRRSVEKYQDPALR